MRNKQINGRYSGVYFGVNYFNHVYEPTFDVTKLLLIEFKHKYINGIGVSYREKHKKTKVGFIDIAAYSTEKNGGGTIKVYLINNRWIEENRIKAVLQPTK